MLILEFLCLFTNDLARIIRTQGKPLFMRLLLYLLFSFPLGLSACSCIFTEYFCDYTESYLEWSPDSVVVMRGRLADFRTPDVNGSLPLYDFKVEEVLVGDFSEPFVSLLGPNVATACSTTGYCTCVRAKK